MIIIFATGRKIMNTFIDSKNGFENCW